MKKCPQCKRTYADDAFTFCLEDGALLSAPYDPGEEKPVSQKRAMSPPTDVMPAPRDAQPTATIPSPPPTKQVVPFTQSQFGDSTPRKSFARYVVVAVVGVVIGVVAIALYAFGRADCPTLIINCTPGAKTTYCGVRDAPASTGGLARPISAALCSRSVILWQVAPMPSEVEGISWSASTAEKPQSYGTQSEITLDTSGLSGVKVTVTAKVHSRKWLCSETLSTSFVVPAAEKLTP
jgi:hypothetical protein